MKHALFVRSVLFASITLVCLPALHAQHFRWGANWAMMDTSRFGSSTVSIMDDYLGLNLYHSKFDPRADGSHSAPAWSRNSKGTLVVGDDSESGYIYAYSSAERITYEGLPKPPSPKDADTLTKYYFHERDTTVGGYFPIPSLATPTHWEITSGSTHTDTRVLWGNEFPNEWGDGNDRHFCVAASLWVLHPPRSHDDSTRDVITVHIIQCNRGDRFDSVIHVPWAFFADTTTSHTFLSEPIRLARSFDNYPYDSLLVEVHSERWVTTRIAWVAVEDTLARDIHMWKDLAGDDGRYSTWYDTYGSIRDSILADTVRLSTAVAANKILYYYLFDEPKVSAYICMGMVNSILNRRGITELGSPYPRRFLAHVQPRVYWPALGADFTGRTSITNQVVPYLDTAINQGYSTLRKTRFNGAKKDVVVRSSSVR
jgi:hypothetical protein